MCSSDSGADVDESQLGPGADAASPEESSGSDESVDAGEPRLKCAQLVPAQMRARSTASNLSTGD